jgi:hypothetical protein
VAPRGAVLDGSGGSELMKVERLTDEEITDLARAIVTNRVYAAWTTEALDNSFGMFLMMIAGSAADLGQDVDWMNDIGMVYEDIAKASERSVNGYPTFFSAQYVHREDRMALNRECIRMAVALGEVPQETLDKFDSDQASHAAAEVKDEEKE